MMFRLAEGSGPEAGETARAYVHLDLYARPGKRSGAWMNVAANRRLSAKGITVADRLADLQLPGTGGLKAGDAHPR
jgi:Zn-dependent oligopeptidase